SPGPVLGKPGAVFSILPQVSSTGIVGIGAGGGEPMGLANEISGLGGGAVGIGALFSEGVAKGSGPGAAKLGGGGGAGLAAGGGGAAIGGGGGGGAGAAAGARGLSAALATRSLTLSIKVCESNGLAMCPSAPTCLLRFSSNGLKAPVKRSTGICFKP